MSKQRIQLSDHFTYFRLLRFVLPCIGTTLFTSIYGIVDGLCVSNFVGKTAFAAVNLIIPLPMLLGTIGFMLGTGGSAIVGITLGEGDQKKADRYFTLFLLAALVSVSVLAVLGIVFLRPIAVLLGAKGELLDYAVRYGRILMLALPPFALQNMFQSIFVTAEKPHLGFWFTVGAGCTNIVLDVLIVGVWGWGVEGAAIATFISQLVGGVLPVFYFIDRSNSSRLHLCKTSFYSKVLRDACINGSSELMTNLSMSLVNILYNYQLLRLAGENGVAAYGVIMSAVFLFVAVFEGYAVGSAPIVSFHYGARNHTEVHNLYRKSLRLIALMSVVLTAAALLLVHPLMTVLRVDPAAWAETRTYLLVVCAGLVGSIGYNLNAGILGGMGNSSTTLLFLAVSTILNIFLDLALVLAVPLGVLGVALGTVIAQLCSWLFGIWYINRRYPQLAIHPFNGIFDRRLFCEIIRIGLPSGIQMSLVALGAMGVLSKVNSYGKAFTAGFNVGNKLDTLSFLPVQSLAAAVISFVGQNMGASREDRVRQGVRITVTMAVVWTVLSSALVVWLSVPLSRIFSPDPAVIAASARYLQCVMPPYVLFAILFVLNSAMRGAGDSLYPMVNVVASVILLRVPFLYLLANRFGPDAMYWSYGIGWAVACALSVYHYAAGKWRGKYRSE